jgi:uncharacterized protein
VGLHGDRLKIAIAAPPVDGKANAALLAFLAVALSLPRRRLRLQVGSASREKCVRVIAMGAGEVAGRLLECMNFADRK